MFHHGGVSLLKQHGVFYILVLICSVVCCVCVAKSNFNWASEASPTLGCSIEISRDIYMYVYMSVCLVCQINCVGGITWTKRAHAQSLFFLAVKPVTPVLFISDTLEL